METDFRPRRRMTAAVFPSMGLLLVAGICLYAGYSLIAVPDHERTLQLFLGVAYLALLFPVFLNRAFLYEIFEDVDTGSTLEDEWFRGIARVTLILVPAVMVIIFVVIGIVIWPNAVEDRNVTDSVALRNVINVVISLLPFYLYAFWADRKFKRIVPPFDRILTSFYTILHTVPIIHAVETR